MTNPTEDDFTLDLLKYRLDKSTMSTSDKERLIQLIKNQKSLNQQKTNEEKKAKK